MQGRSPTSGVPGEAGNDVEGDRPPKEVPASAMVGEGERSATRVVDERSARDLLRIVLGSVVAPTTALTALLYYFGWVVTNAQASVFGLDESALGYSTRDYLLRSTGALFVPLGGVLLLGIVWLWAHTVLSGWLERPARREKVARLTRVILAAGVVAFVIGLFGVIRPHSMSTIVPPLAFSLGIPLSAYAAFLRGRLQTDQRSPATPLGPELRALNATMVGLLVALSVFWMIGDYAESVGRVRALEAMERLATRPSVTVYSTNPLNIVGPGVEETELPGPDSAERFRYSGLKLLFRANGKYFLVPKGWLPSNGTTIVLPDGQAFRFEFTRAAD